MSQITESISFKIDGEFDALKMDTAVAMMRSIQALSQSIAYEFGEAYQVEVRIPEIRKGSFEIETVWSLGLVMGGMDISSILQDAATTAKVVAPFVKEALNLKKFLGGKKPRSISSVDGDDNVVTIANSDGDFRNANVTINNFVLNNPVFNGPAFNNGIKALEDDTETTSLSLLDGNTAETFERDSFKALGHRFDKELVDGEEELQPKRVRKKLVVVTPVIVKPKRQKAWEFQYLDDGGKIEAHIEDEEFLDRAQHKGHSFSTGTTLDVALRIEYSYQGASYPQPSRFIVEKVYDVID